MILVFLVVTLAIGISLAGLLLSSSTFPDRLVLMGLSIGAGIGMSSLIFFLLLLIFGSLQQWFIIFDVLVFYLFFQLLITKKGTPRRVGKLQFPKIQLTKKQRSLFYLFTGCTFIALLVFILRSILNQHGDWDGWAIWNLHARFLLLGGIRWKNMFTSELDWTRPDYPLLIPIAISRGWEYVSTTSVLIPILIALLFTFGTVFLLISSLFILKSATQGVVSGFILLCTPYFIAAGASQYADIPFSYFMLAMFVLFLLYDRQKKTYSYIFFAGMNAGFALFTKNEGYLLFVVILLCRYVPQAALQKKSKWGRELAIFIAGVFPLLLINLYVKYFLAPTNYLLRPSTTSHALPQLLDYSRYARIAEDFIKNMLTFGDFSVDIIMLLVFYALFFGVTSHKILQKNAALVISVILGMLIGYFFVYVLTPYDLSWQLSSSLKRLFIQIWPSVLLGFFLLVKSPEEAIKQVSMEQRKPKTSRIFKT